MEMEERKRREGGKDEGRKVTRSDRERETGMGWGGGGEMEKRMRGVRDAADPPV